MKVHIISYTPLDAPGGVPRFNRYLKRVLEEVGHEVRHWSWWDMSAGYHMLANHCNSPEDARASILSRYLDGNHLISRDDVIIGDGFWCGDFAKMGYKKVISVAHGIWGHVTKADIDAGIQPENPGLHAAQIAHRRDHQRRGLPIVAVSRFIKEQMELQWGIEASVINNAVDPEDFGITCGPLPNWTDDICVVHGINERGNTNKGWDHIQACMDAVKGLDVRVDFYSLDELHEFLEAEKFQEPKNKMWSLMNADVALIPSGYEGNSYFALECLNIGVPCVAYDVGLFREFQMDSLYRIGGELEAFGDQSILSPAGVIMPRTARSPRRTADGLLEMINLQKQKVFSAERVRDRVREVASFDLFRYKWQEAIESICLFS